MLNKLTQHAKSLSFALTALLASPMILGGVGFLMQCESPIGLCGG